MKNRWLSSHRQAYGFSPPIYNGKKHFLVSVSDDKKVDLKKLGEQLNEKLSFASESRLQKYLGVTHGAVSPLGVLNDESNSVVVILDKDIMKWEKIGVHPNDNTATVWLTPQDLEKVLKESGNLVEVKEL